MKKLFIIALFIILMVGLVSAIELVPQGNINGKGIRSIKNFTNISADLFCDDQLNCYNITTLAAGESDTDTQKSGGLPFNYNDSGSIYTNQTALFENMSTDGTTFSSKYSEDTDTTYSAGENMSLSGTTFSSKYSVDTDTTYACSDWSACTDNSLWDANKLDGQIGSYYLDNTINTSAEVRATIFGDDVVNATADLPMGGFNLTHVDCIVGLGGGVIC